MSLNYSLVLSTDVDAFDCFVESSSYGNPFIHSTYINSLNVKCHRYVCKKGNELVAKLLVVVSDDGESIIGDDLVIYDGVVFRDFPALNRAQQLSEQFKILEFIGNELTQLYRRIRLTLSPRITDIRAFQWVNYHNDFPKYGIDLRYTALADISDFIDSNEYQNTSLYLNASVSRRQEIRYALKKNVLVRNNLDIESFLSAFIETFERQQSPLSETNLKRVRKLIEGLSLANRLICFEAISEDGNVNSFALFLVMGNNAYYLFGANKDAARSSHTGTAVLWQSFFHLARKGVKLVDLEGVNSPQRGWFKLSFGAEIQSYFQLTYAR